MDITKERLAEAWGIFKDVEVLGPVFCYIHFFPKFVSDFVLYVFIIQTLYIADIARLKVIY